MSAHTHFLWHLLEELQADAKVTAHLAPARLGALLDPESYTGLATEFVDRVLAHAPSTSE